MLRVSKWTPGRMCMTTWVVPWVWLFIRRELATTTERFWSTEPRARGPRATKAFWAAPPVALEAARLQAQRELQPIHRQPPQVMAILAGALPERPAAAMAA